MMLPAIVAAAARRRNGPPAPSSPPYNGTPITVPTYDGSGQLVHPDVIDFQQEIGGPWNGHRFWMAFTPYPNSINTYENPCIVVSQNGVDWSVPDGLTNPLYPTPPVGYNADTDITYDPDTGDLVLAYMSYNLAEVTLPLARSVDGVTWPSSTGFLPNEGGGTALAPSMVRDPDGTWHLWIQRNGGIRHRTAPSPEGSWSAWGATTGTPADIWHHNVIRAPGGRYLMLSHCRSTVTRRNGWLQASSSVDGITWTTNPAHLVTSGNTADDSDDVYRPALTLHENGTHARVWYSGRSAASVWRLFHTLIPLDEWPAP
ncbi:hypothetical protein [Citricoccus sp.]|uniref:hypothetical protein n=1 Tax=Citricoccus sp. TaxID=1978372 RepID=UPI002BD2ECDD|nr:hypothetical protein [Citricoccus sp.]HRO95088.1 hypothetical protein [Citricoccus sp.]